MNRADALPYLSYCVDDTLSPRELSDMPNEALLVGWQCGFEPLFVAVWSYLPGVRLDMQDAEDIATDYLAELGWFGEARHREPDFII